MAKAVWLKQGSEKYYPAPYWPIGSIYISVVNTNPSQWFGGTWAAFGTGRCLVGVDTTQTEFNTVMKTGGEKTHKLTINEMPSHNHRLSFGQGNNSAGNPGVYGTDSNAKPYTEGNGGDKPHNNLQPYITVYMWRRTA